MTADFHAAIMLAVLLSLVAGPAALRAVLAAEQQVTAQAELASQRAQAADREAALRAHIEALFGSASWRITRPLRWVSRSQRQIARVLGERGFAVSQKLVGLLLRELGYSFRPARAALAAAVEWFSQRPDR